MGRGITIADLVQQVLFRVYGVRLETDGSDPGLTVYSCTTDRYREIVMAANIVLEELQKEADWSFLRTVLELGFACNGKDGRPCEMELPEWTYRPAIGYDDSVRLLLPCRTLEIPWVQARQLNHRRIEMIDELGLHDVPDFSQKAALIGSTVAFSRPWADHEDGYALETDVIRRIDPLPIVKGRTATEEQRKEQYEKRFLTEIPDIQYVVAKTAVRRAEVDPSAVDRVQPLTDEATRYLSAMRENDSAHNYLDNYHAFELGYVEVL